MPDCPICSDPMSPGDLSHPIQCLSSPPTASAPTADCTFNFCLSCVESLIASSRDGYGIASDGNRHVKVRLRCPQCRSDMEGSILDTVLLRKVRTLTTTVCSGGGGVIEEGGDSELSASELRMKAELTSDYVRNAISEAERREVEFFSERNRRRLERGGEATAGGGGVEAIVEDLAASALSYDSTDPAPVSVADVTLFGGREYAMTKDEQMVVTEMMNSGSVTKLSAAALFLHDVIEMSRAKGGRTGKKREEDVMRGSSIRTIIEEGKEARERYERRAFGTRTGMAAAVLSNRGEGGGEGGVSVAGGGSTAQSTSSTRRRGKKANMVTKSRHRDFEREMSRRADFLCLRPLPVRMPRHVELSLSDPNGRNFPLAFCDDVWDGTVEDAYRKITIVGKRGLERVVRTSERDNPGVQMVVMAGGAATGDYDAMNRILEERGGGEGPESSGGLPNKSKKRVLISIVRPEAGRLGVARGDVVTHMDGEELNFEGTGKTASELMEVLVRKWDRGERTFSLVLNAEQCTAEALRRRALVEG